MTPHGILKFDLMKLNGKSWAERFLKPRGHLNQGTLRQGK